MSTIITDVITAPAHWACYLIYGDASDMTEAEMDAADEYFLGWDVVDVIPDSERFTWAFNAHGGDAAGGNVCDYLVYVP